MLTFLYLHFHLPIIDFRAEHQRPRVSETRCAEVWKREAVLWYPCSGASLRGKWFGFHLSLQKSHYIYLFHQKHAVDSPHEDTLVVGQASRLGKPRRWLKCWWGWQCRTWTSSTMTWSPKCSRWDCRRRFVSRTVTGNTRVSMTSQLLKKLCLNSRKGHWTENVVSPCSL